MIKTKTVFNDYATAVAWIKEGRSGYDRPVANNTRLVLHQSAPLDFVGLQLHQTDVIKIYENGDIEFSTGGWWTKTTLARIGLNYDFRLRSNGEAPWTIVHVPTHERVERQLREKYGLPETWKTDSEWATESEWLGFIGARSRGHGFWEEAAELIGRKEAVAIQREFTRELVERTSHEFFDGIRFTKRGRRINDFDRTQSIVPTAVVSGW